MTVYGYARVSTKSQKLDVQIQDLLSAGVKKSNIYCEKFTGTTTNRPVFNQLLKRLKQGDTLTVVKLDRLARNTKQALQIIQDFNTKGIILNVLNIGKIDNSPTGKLLFTVFSAFADFERDLIVARTHEGKEFAKKYNQNFKDGRPRKFTDTQIKTAYNLYEQKHWTYKKISQETGISQSTLYNRFREIRNQKDIS